MSAASYYAELAEVAAEASGEKAEARPEPVALAEHLHQVDPGPHLGWWHVGAMIEACQGVLDGEIERLLISAPPRTYKSRTVIQGTSSCRLRNEPRSKIYVTCADDELARYHGRYAKLFCESAGVHLRQDAKAAGWWETLEHGMFKAATIRSGMLGVGWDLGMVDDPFRSRMEAQNPLAQKTVWNLYRDDFLTRKQDRPEGGAPTLVVMHQRLSVGDLAGRLLRWLEEATAEEWHVLTLKGYAERASVVLPACCVVIEDPREPGAPLCDDEGIMREIEDRRRTNPPLHRAVDQQDPAEDAGGGVFCRSWFRLVDESPALTRVGRGWDFNAGGTDAAATARGGAHSADSWIWLDARESYPAPAALAGLVLDTARDDGQGVEVVLPNEPAVGKAFSERLAVELRREGFTVHLAGQREPKRSRSLSHAAAASARCESCHQLIVPESAEDMFRSQGLCRCPEPDGDGYGRVSFLVGDWNDLAGDRLHSFTGEPGGKDDLPDAMAVVYNALAPAPCRVAVPGIF
jgi:hypothetical protein